MSELHEALVAEVHLHVKHGSPADPFRLARAAAIAALDHVVRELGAIEGKDLLRQSAFGSVELCRGKVRGLLRELLQGGRRR